LLFQLCQIRHFFFSIPIRLILMFPAVVSI